MAITHIILKQTGEGAVLPDMPSRTVTLSTGRVVTGYLTGEDEVTVITGAYETFENDELTDEISREKRKAFSG